LPPLSYDLVFAGNIAFDEIHPFEGEPHTLFGSAVYFAAMATAWSERKIALVARIALEDVPLLEPMRNTRIAIHISPAEVTTRHQAFHPTENIDDRQVVQPASAGHFSIDDLPPMEPTLVHLASVTDQDFTVEFIRDLHDRGFACTVDMQGFVRHVDTSTGSVAYGDVAAKEEIARMTAKMKLDVLEARYLTGTSDMEEAAAIIEGWGCPEVMVTGADGVVVRHGGRIYRERFSYRNISGRTGRGDTVFGSYLARRLDHDITESLAFASALASIKVETPGPFTGSVDQVLERMGTQLS